MSPAMIESLDSWWVSNVLMHPRDDKGNLILSRRKSPSEQPSMEELFFDWFRKIGYPEYRIRQEWDEYQRIQVQKN